VRQRPYLPLRLGRRGLPPGPVPRAATIALEIGAAGVLAGPLARRGAVGPYYGQSATGLGRAALLQRCRRAGGPRYSEAGGASNA
jgi:hypothetical protein